MMAEAEDRHERELKRMRSQFVGGGAIDDSIAANYRPTLADFLLARIAEDEEIAETATSGPWSLDDRDEVWAAGGNVQYLACPAYRSDGEHIARHDPARVRAECEAKRRIVDLHVDIGGECGTCAMQSGPGGLLDPAVYPCDTILALAQPYADHDGFRPEWRVSPVAGSHQA